MSDLATCQKQLKVYLHRIARFNKTIIYARNSWSSSTTYLHYSKKQGFFLPIFNIFFPFTLPWDGSTSEFSLLKINKYDYLIIGKKSNKMKGWVSLNILLSKCVDTA